MGLIEDFQPDLGAGGREFESLNAHSSETLDYRRGFLFLWMYIISATSYLSMSILPQWGTQIWGTQA